MNLFVLLGYAIPLLVGLTSIAWASGLLRNRRNASLVGWVGIVFFGIQLVAAGLSPFGGRFDFTAFWEAGRDVLAGRDPIALFGDNPLPVLNPPSAYPLFAGLAAMPYLTSFFVWTIANGVFLVLTAELAIRIVPDTDRTTALLFLATLTLSNAARACLTSGQLSILTALCLVASVRPGGASFLERGFWLGLSTIKVGTTAPFCLFFIRRKDWKVLITAGVIFIALSSVTGSPLRLPERMQGWWACVQRVSQPGTANDFAYTSAANDDMIGLDHAFYRLGLRDRTAAKIAQMITLGIIGLTLLEEFARRSRMSTESSVAVLSLFAALFLYHRLGDMTILAVPLLLALRRATQAQGRERKVWTAAAAGLIVVLFLQRRILSALAIRFIGKPGLISELVQALILPHAAWILLGLLVFFWRDGTGRRVQREAP